MIKYERNPRWKIRQRVYKYFEHLVAERRELESRTMKHKTLASLSTEQ